MNLDAPTIIFLTIINTAIMGVGLLVIRRGSIGQVPGVSMWGKATLIQALGWLVLGARGVIPDAISIVVGNGLILLSLAWYLLILAEFANRRIRAAWAYAIVMLEASVLLYFSAVEPNLTARIIVISVCTAILTLRSAQVLLSGRPNRHSSHSFTAGILGLSGVFMVARALYYLIFNPAVGQAALSLNTINSVSYLALHIMAVLLTYGFVLMCSDRYVAQKLNAEKSSQEDNSFARIIADNTPGMVGYWTRDLVCAFANWEYVTWFGRTPGQMQGMRMQDLLGPALFQANWPYIQGALRGEKQQFERTLTKPDGEIGYTLARYIPHKVNDQVEGFFVLVTDITAIQFSYELLQKSEAYNKAMIDAIPDLIFTHHRDGEYLSVHAPDPHQLYLPPEEFLHRRIDEILPDSVARILMEAITAAFVSGAQEVRYPLLMQDGQERFFEARVVSSDTDTVLCLVRDITERERDRRNREAYAAQLSGRLELSEADLREHEQMLALAADAANLGVWTYDYIQDEYKVSDYWRMLFGFEPLQPLSTGVVVGRILPEDRAVFIKNLKVARAGDAHFENTCRVALPDGGIRWIASRGRVEFDADKRPVFIRGISVDITQRKRNELEIEQRQLEVTYLSRLASLGELSGAMAHELNQPLMSILINAEAGQLALAQSSDSHPELNDILQDIVDEGIRAGEIIRSLRKMFGKREMVFQKTDVNALLSDVCRLLRNDLLRQGVTLNTDLAAGPRTVDVDPVQIEQVLINLVTNACDAMASIDVVERKVILRTAVDEHDRLQVSVVDQGSGIGNEDMEKIFEPFFTTKSEGMGLGLSICRNIINANGGHLWAENNFDSGASFHFCLPISSGEN